MKGLAAGIQSAVKMAWFHANASLARQRVVPAKTGRGKGKQAAETLVHGKMARTKASAKACMPLSPG